MSELEAMPPPVGATAETFCVYLAKQLVVNRGFRPGTVSEAAPLTAQSDIVLSFSDGYSFSIVGLIDRETHPHKAFTLTSDELDAIGKACLRYAGRINGARMPVTLQLMEVGPASADQPVRLGEIQRSSLFSKVHPSAWVVDTTTGTVWTSASWHGRTTKHLLERLLNSPRETVVARPPVAVASRGFPWLTAAILGVLVAVFTAEIVFGVGGEDKLLQPKLATLLAFGGLSRNVVLNSGEWYRIFSAPFLHADAGHLGMNAISLAMAGYVLESIIGRAWFAAIYAVGAICGSLLSLMLNPANIVSVGASGAAMALFAAMLLVSRHFPPGATRSVLQTNAIYVLVPNLLPLTSVLKGIKVDYAAHFGGAIGGIAVALAALALWRRSELRPRFRWAALLIAIAGCGGVAWAAGAIPTTYPMYEFSSALVPQAQMPATDAAARSQSASLVARYPRDPRVRLMLAGVLLQSKDFAGAERELRAGLAEEAVWRPLFTSDLPARMHTLLALVLGGTGRMDEARSAARPVCAASKDAPGREMLERQRLCAD